MGNIIIANDSNSLLGIKYAMRLVLQKADEIWHRHGQTLVVTHGVDGSHSAASYHYYGLALDFRTNFFGRDQAEVVCRELKDSLPDYYDVILHSTHMHVEFDVNKWRRTQPSVEEMILMLS